MGDNRGTWATSLGGKVNGALASLRNGEGWSAERGEGNRGVGGEGPTESWGDANTGTAGAFFDGPGNVAGVASLLAPSLCVVHRLFPGSLAGLAVG